MDNCEVHESEIALPGLRIELLPPRPITKYQTLGLALISYSKTLYRSNLLRMAVNVMLQKQSGDWDFPASSQRGVFGVRDGFLPTIGDAMEIFNEAWHATSRSTAIQCWLKSQCLPELHREWCTELLRDILTTSIYTSDLDAPILNSEVQSIDRDLSTVQSLVIPQTPASVTLEEANLINNTVSLNEVLNSAAQFDSEPSLSEVFKPVLKEMFDSRVQLNSLLMIIKKLRIKVRYSL